MVKDNYFKSLRLSRIKAGHVTYDPGTPLCVDVSTLRYYVHVARYSL